MSYIRFTLLIYIYVLYNSGVLCLESNSYFNSADKVSFILSLLSKYRTTSFVGDYPTNKEVAQSMADLFLRPLLEVLEDKQLNISATCKTTLRNSYYNDDEQLKMFYITKLLSDSSKNKNDLTTYEDCMRKVYLYTEKDKPFNITGKFTYLMTTFEQSNNNNNTNYTLLSTDYGTRKFTFGLCLPSGCNETEYRSVIFLTLKNIAFLFTIDNPDQIDLLQLEDYRIQKDTNMNKLFFIELIPLGIFLLFTLIIIFGFFPFCIYKYFFKNPNYSRLDGDDKSTNRSQMGMDKKKRESSKLDASLPNNPNTSNFSNGGNLSVFSSEHYSKKTSYYKDYIQRMANPPKNISKKYNWKDYLQFKHSMSFLTNAEELFSYNLSSQSKNNDSDFKYIKGLRGISMIFLIMGSLFFDLFNSPVSVYGEFNFIRCIKSFFYAPFYFGMRYSPRILLSCSGYCLFYKFMHYLDNSYDEVIDEKVRKKRNKKKKKENADDYKKFDPNLMAKDEESESNQNLTSEYDSDEEEEEEENEDDSYNQFDPDHTIQKKDMMKIKESGRKLSDIRCSMLFGFYLRQIHKYILFVLVILFMRFSLINIFNLLFSFNTGPMWKYFHDKINNSQLSQLIIGMLSLYPMVPNQNGEDVFLNYLWLISNEIVFLIMTTIILHFGYKFKVNVSKFINGLIVFTMLVKFIFFVFNGPIEHFRNQTMYYYYFDFGNVIINPFYNYMYYLLGVFFGSMNYTLQKEMDYQDAENQEKPFLYSSIKNVKWFQKLSNSFVYTMSFVFICLIVLFSLLNWIVLRFFDEQTLLNNHLTDYLQNVFNNFFLMYDIDFVVIMIHFLAFALYLKGSSFIPNILTHPFWSIFDKFYVSFILVINPVFLYLLYQSETRINMNLYNCYLYSIIGGFLVFIVAGVFYILFELPLKKLIRLVIKSFKKGKLDDDEFLRKGESYRPLYKTETSS